MEQEMTPETAQDLIKRKLEKSIWFTGWNTFEIKELILSAKMRKYYKSELIYRDGETRPISFLISGSAWACLRSGESSKKFDLANSSSLIGISSILRWKLHDEPNYEFYAAEECNALIISPEYFIRQLNSSPNLWRSIAEAAITYQRHCTKIGLVLRSGPISERLISAIYQHSTSYAKQLSQLPRRELTILQNDLADLIQSSRQNVNSGLRELESEGILSVGYRKILINDIEKIERRAKARFSPTEI